MLNYTFYIVNKQSEERASMLLKKIKLSGFKSFVDPTQVMVPSSMVGIVGPNGCGKSNVIDAVRWVMGESSAKTLRGESMDDVIFNGSTGRAPVNQASVELVFDNQDGTVGGEYAGYAEIAVRREVSREGQSSYFLNGTKCRRKDISGVFLGTGLGPRSYSIIQQGTISRLIEAKPEELRMFLEEAAGISKYKARRRETENRIRHTRENLDRLNDIRMELEKQLSHLQRQANAANRYKVLKQEQRETKARSHAVRWQSIDGQIEQCRLKFQSKETELEAKIAELRRVETEIERSRDQQSDTTESFNDIQSKYYSVGGEIGKIEQVIAHQQERKEQLSFDLEQTQQHWQDLKSSLDTDQTQISELDSAIDSLLPQAEQAQQKASHAGESLSFAEKSLQEWQKNWDEISEKAATATQAAEVQKTQIEHLEQRIVTIQSRCERIAGELSIIDLTALEQQLTQLSSEKQSVEGRMTDKQAELEQLTNKLATNKEKVETETKTLDENKAELQRLVGKQASLEALQNAALNKDNETAQNWLTQNNLANRARLAQTLQVESGWETAVETVLGGYLQAICVDEQLDSLVSKLGQYEGSSLTLMTALSGADSNVSSLQSKVKTTHALPQLQNVLTASSLNDALAKQKQLSAQESVITQEGIWLGPNWVRVVRDEDAQAGVLQRERQLREVAQQFESLQTKVSQSETDLDNLKTLVTQLEAQREACQKQCHEYQGQLSQLQAQEEVKAEKLESEKEREQKLHVEHQELGFEQTKNQEKVVESRATLESTIAEMQQYHSEREALSVQRELRQTAVTDARTQAQREQAQAHELEVKLQTSQTQQSSLKQNIDRLQNQYTSLSDRKQQLHDQMHNSDEPLKDLEAQREELLEQRLTVEKTMNDVREKVASLDQSLRSLEKQRHDADENIQSARQGLESGKLEVEGYRVRKQTLVEQLEEMSLTVQEVLGSIEEPVAIEQLEEQLEHIDRRISRLGAINLAAIDEFKEKQERKEYLDAQNDDLESALTTLENAMAKIDKETRQKFRETYDIVNSGFKELFPKVFGGGGAYLELTGNDLLDTGVTVIAQPPGKKNTTIHLLSGGEKALTALALVFSIFKLNPSPFCMLDEVDAPLDDANVNRFCDLVKEMSSMVQFVVITHNKVTMEMMHQLTGVTMHEPGVSRLVSVDVNEAAKMVEA